MPTYWYNPFAVVNARPRLTSVEEYVNDAELVEALRERDDEDDHDDAPPSA